MHTPDIGYLKLPETLDQTMASPLSHVLLDNRGSSIIIDAADVKQLSALCVQVLLSAKKTWSAQGNTFVVSNASREFVRDIEHLGFGEQDFRNGDLPECN